MKTDPIALQNDLAELEFLARKDSFIDEFTDQYSRILGACRANPDRNTLEAMQLLLMSQAQYLMTEWINNKGQNYIQ
ncbi:MAG: hypothetical protein ABIJ52_03365 [Pseudomonadota bacterium]|nr:hypothetical protein [Pseudomonadota bacterium]